MVSLELSKLSNIELYEFLRKRNLSKTEYPLIEKELRTRGIELAELNILNVNIGNHEKEEGITNKSKILLLLAPLFLITTLGRTFIWIAILFLFIYSLYYKGTYTIQKEKQCWNYFSLGFAFWSVITIMFFLIID